MPTREKEKNSTETIVESADINTEAETKDTKRSKKAEKADQKPKKAKSVIGKIIPIVILLLVFGAIIGILFFNIFNIRDQYLSNVLRQIPIVSNLLPAEETPSTTDQLTTLTTEQLVAEINRLTTELDKQKQDNTTLEGINTDYAAQIAQLKDLENQQLQFKQDKANFDQMVALGDPASYSTYYSSISPENAAALYEQSLAKVQNLKEIKKYVSDLSSMDEASAAAVMEEMIKTDMDLVAMIFEYLDSETAGAILQSMSATNAASVAKRIAPTPIPAATPLPVYTDAPVLPTAQPLE